MSEGPYKLPEGWKWVKLGEVCEILQGKTPPKNAYTSEQTPIKMLKFRDLTVDGRIVWDNNERGFVHSDEKWRYVALGDVLITAAAHTPEQIGKKVAIVDHIPAEYSRVAVTGELLIFRALPHLLDSYWLRHWLASADGYKLLQTQVKEKHLVQSRAQNIPIPLPPLPEQKRIVARIEELMERIREARRLREEAKQDAERLWQSVLAETFPRPGAELPEGWRWVRLGEIFDLQQGTAMSPMRRLGRNPKPFLRTKNILWGLVNVSSVDEMDFTEEEVERLRLQPGDLLVCEGGEVGQTAIWEGQLPVALYQNHIHRLRRKSDHVEPRFFMYWMQAAYQVFRAYQGAESRTAIPNLSGRRLKAFLAPLPPLPEQKRIVAHLEAVQERIKAIKEAQAHTEAELKRLEQAILEKAFRGEL